MLHPSCVCHASSCLPWVLSGHPAGRLSWGAGREQHVGTGSEQLLSPAAFGAPTPMPPFAHDGHFALSVCQGYGHTDFRRGVILVLFALHWLGFKAERVCWEEKSAAKRSYSAIKY